MGLGVFDCLFLGFEFLDLRFWICDLGILECGFWAFELFGFGNVGFGILGFWDVGFGIVYFRFGDLRF